MKIKVKDATDEQLIKYTENNIRELDGDFEKTPYYKCVVIRDKWGDGKWCEVQIYGIMLLHNRKLYDMDLDIRNEEFIEVA